LPRALRVLFIASLALNLECPAANSHRLGNRCLFVRIVSTISRCESGVSLLIARLLASERLAASVNRAELFMIPVQVAKLDDRVKMEKRGRFRLSGPRFKVIYDQEPVRRRPPGLQLGIFTTQYRRGNFGERRSPTARKTPPRIKFRAADHIVAGRNSWPRSRIDGWLSQYILN
jgi:hypothetical protein